MANAVLGGYTFDVNPRTVSWGYTLNVNPIETKGGRIIQILNVHVNDIKLEGDVRQMFSEQFDSMERFEALVKGMMDRQLETKRPYRFSMPILGIEGNVFIKSYGAVSYDYKSAVHSYTITLGVDSGFGELRSMVSNAAVSEMWGATFSGVGLVSGNFRIPSTTSWDDVIAVANMLYSEDALSNDQSLLSMFNSITAASAAANSVGVVGEDEQDAIDWAGNLFGNADLPFLSGYDASSLTITKEGFRQFAVDYLENYQHSANQYTQICSIISREDGTYTITVLSQPRSVDTVGIYGTHLDTGSRKEITMDADEWSKLLATWDVIGYRNSPSSMDANKYIGMDDYDAIYAIGADSWVETKEETTVTTVAGVTAKGFSQPQRKTTTETVWTYTPIYGSGGVVTRNGADNRM